VCDAAVELRRQAEDRLHQIVLHVHKVHGRPTQPIAVGIGGRIVIVAPDPAQPSYESILTILEGANIIRIYSC
jgi:hypothetical protein